MTPRSFSARQPDAWTLCDTEVPGGDTYSARRDIVEPDILATLDRCFRLLAGAKRGSTPSNSGTLIGRCLRRPVFESIKHRVTRMDHNLFDVIWPAVKRYGIATSYSKESSGRSFDVQDVEEDTGGVVAPDYESYIVFHEFLDPLLRDLHCVTSSGDLPNHPPPSFFRADGSEDNDKAMSEVIAMLESYDIDPGCKFVQFGTIECCRNLESYTLPLTLTVNQLEAVERVITNELMNQKMSAIMAEGSSEDEGGTYYTLNEILDQPSSIRNQLANSGLLLPLTEFEIHDEKRLHGRHWPYGRGVYVASPGDLAVWVNVQDHLRAICRTSEKRPGNIGQAFIRLAKVMQVFDKKLEFKRDKIYGFLSARPYAIGNTLKFSLAVKLPELSKEINNLRQLCTVRGLSLHETMRSDTVKLVNVQSLSLTELQSLEDFCRAIMNIFSLEKDLSLNNSVRIVNLITGIFQKRKSNPRKFQH